MVMNVSERNMGNRSEKKSFSKNAKNKINKNRVMDTQKKE